MEGWRKGCSGRLSFIPRQGKGAYIRLETSQPMDGWRKPKRKAVEVEAPPPTTTNVKNTANTRHQPSECDLNREHDALPSLNDADLTRLMTTLRTDLDTVKKTFTAQRNPKHKQHDRQIPRPDETEQQLLATQDALLSASEKVKQARTERDALRAERDELEKIKNEFQQQFLRGAEAEQNATVEAATLRREIEDLRNEQATVSTTAEPAAITATLTTRAETAERKVQTLRQELWDVRIELDELTQTNKQLTDTLNLAQNIVEREARRRDAQTAELDVLRKAAADSKKKEKEANNEMEEALNEARRANKQIACLTSENHEELSALRVAVSVSKVAAETAEKARSESISDREKALHDIQTAREETRVMEQRAQEASDTVNQIREEGNIMRQELSVAEKRLRQLAGAITAVDTAMAGLRSLVQGVAVNIVGDTQNQVDTLNVENQNQNQNGLQVPFVSLAESLGPVRVVRGDLNESDVPASAEAVPVMAPVPTAPRRATRLRGK